MFSKKKVGALSSGWIDRKKRLNPTSLLFGSAFLVAVILILLIAKEVAWFTVHTVERFTWSAMKLVSQQAGEPMQRDQYGHINVLIVGYAGGKYRGWLLTDTLMLASFNPDEEAVSFISIPRDLYVRFWRGATSKINSLYRSMYLEGKEDHELGISSLLEKVRDITGVPVHYYAMVDFDWFVEFIDEMGGVEVDVKEPVYDDQYPGPNDSYTIFQVGVWKQQFDGATALKFARSRKSTSDFSRSFRQQQIIAAVIDKIKASVSLTNMGNVKSLYTKGMSIFKTNISLENMLWVSQFSEKKPEFFSFVFESDCQTTTYSVTKPGCVLKYGSKAAFGGQSVIVPDGATPSNLSYYVKTQDVAYWLVYRQDILKEKAPLVIQNGIDKEVAKAQGYKTNGVADEVGVELVLRWFALEDVTNADAPLEKTTLYVHDEKSYKNTIDALAAFIPYSDVIETDQYGSGITIILGNDWLKRL